MLYSQCLLAPLGGLAIMQECDKVQEASNCVKKERWMSLFLDMATPYKVESQHMHSPFMAKVTTDHKLVLVYLQAGNKCTIVRGVHDS